MFLYYPQNVFAAEGSQHTRRGIVMYMAVFEDGMGLENHIKVGI